MMRQVVALMVAMDMTTTAAFGAGEILNFAAEATISTEPYALGQVPAEGFVVTDFTIVNHDGAQGFEWIVMEDNGTNETLVFFWPADNSVKTLRSGIPFAGGSTIMIANNAGPVPVAVSFSGYVPCANPCDPCVSTVPVPAVGSAGLAVLALLLLAAGGAVISRRRRVE